MIYSNRCIEEKTEKGRKRRIMCKRREEEEKNKKEGRRIEKGKEK